MAKTKKGMKRKSKVQPEGQPAAQAEVVSELRAIKSILLALAVKIGVTSEELGAALGITGRHVRRIIPTTEIRKLNFAAADENR